LVPAAVTISLKNITPKNTERLTMPKIIAMLHSVASLRPVFFSYSFKSSLLRSTWKAL
jgi:hypothetical protein